MLFYKSMTSIRNRLHSGDLKLFSCAQVQDHLRFIRFIRQRQNQIGNGQRAITGISEAEQRRKQYQAEVGVTGTGSEFQGQAVRGQTQR